tara:strand:- start:1251 stop:1379 length:129 start_codon:yes stop_codon:yes gene_type:complete
MIKNHQSFSDILNHLQENGVEIQDISTDDGDLEDVFVQLTND